MYTDTITQQQIEYFAGQGLHVLELIDHSPNFLRHEYRLFRTAEGARGYAAKNGTFYGMMTYRVGGQSYRPNVGDESFAETPCGCVGQQGSYYLYGEAA